jgi:hypothetical protein
LENRGVCEDNIEIDLREVGWGGGMDWINLAQDRDRRRALVKAVMNLQVPLNAGNFLSSLGRFNFSGRTLLHGVSKYGVSKHDSSGGGGGGGGGGGEGDDKVAVPII